VTQFVSKEPGRECLHCSAILSWRRAKYCNNACRAAGNGFQPPKGRRFVRGPSSQATPEFRASVIAMWDDGATATQIGLRHGRSKNSIIGYVHRWHLPPRPSPITLVYGPPRPPRAPMPRAVPRHIPTLAPLSSLARRTAPIIPPKVERVVRVPQDKPERPNEPQRQCAWLDGDKPNWRQCTNTAVSNCPYCEQHRDRAYVRTPRISTFGLVA
jgi:GcrA cell cycle regulator